MTTNISGVEYSPSNVVSKGGPFHPKPRPRPRPHPVPVPLPLVVPTPAPVPPQASKSPDMGAVVAIINRERTVRGMGTLSVHPALMNAAKQHSDDMSAHQKMDHQGSDGSNPVDRMAANGYTNAWTGEIIAFGTGLSEEDVVRLWINSPPHYAIMFNPIYTDVGAGEAGLSPQAGYWTVDFGHRA